MLLARSLCGVALLLLCAGGAAAWPQQAGAPVLQRRSQADLNRDMPLLLAGRTDLPADEADAASGEYAFGSAGEVIEIDFEGTGTRRQLTGYISRLGVGDTDRGTPLTYFFGYSKVTPGELTFATRTVHGRWWSFVGTIERGTASSPSQRGYYVLTGTLLEHLPGEQGTQTGRVSLPLLPRNGGLDAH